MIHNVFYIPKFTLNILFVHSLTSSLNYQLTFSSDTCDIQEMSTYRIIGQVSIHNGLYQIQCTSKAKFVLSMQIENLFEHINNIDVWHCRLYHPLSKVLECLSKEYDDIHFDKNNVYTPCPLAKQHKLPFPLSNSICKEAFDIVYVDI